MDDSLMDADGDVAITEQDMASMATFCHTSNSGHGTLVTRWCNMCAMPHAQILMNARMVV